jgi:2-oxoglutarate dehydrogenase E2 component (dihydrolipoamide succinyltransferase)
MAVKSVVMPQLGESVAEATLARWLVKEGDLLARDQTFAEASTDKADTELPAPFAGRVVRRLIAEGATVPVNTPILEVETEASAAQGPREVARPGEAPTPTLASPAGAPRASALPAARKAEEAPGAEPAVAASRIEPEPPAAPRSEPTPARQADGRDEPRSSPLVRRIAREQRVELAQLTGTGVGGRVTKSDIVGFLSSREAGGAAPPPVRAPQPVAAPKVQPTAPPAREVQPAAPPVAPGKIAAGPIYKPPEYRALPGDEVIPFTRRRRLIAEHMVYSKRVAPHVACMAEVELHRVERARRRAAERGEKVSMLAFVAVAMVKAAREVPVVNATVLEGAYALHRQVNLGIAVETEEGLVVPVIPKADELSLVGMARAIAERAEKARAGKLTADELSFGTLTLSNPGARGNLWGAAIINQPQVAIVRMGEIVKRPVVITVEEEDAIVIRPVMNLTLSYDHRIVDGVAGNDFLRRIKERLEARPEGP